MIGYHVTTDNKFRRYVESGCILSPVRFWPNLLTAQRWAKKTGRKIILRITVPGRSYPLPAPRPGRWTDSNVKVWETVQPQQ